ncbi:MAG: NUDIX hydrolase [Actinobacteria bacterium]|nr:NUDIX hydrolase [Actinomycetota bacterium]
MTRVIRAAGGLVMRKTGKGRIRVLAVHRPAYDDWSLPKGKIEDGEGPETAALREVLEETGYSCRIVAPLATTRHTIAGGVKEVVWFAMRPLPASPGFVPNDEIDQIAWLGPKKARRALVYENERELIDPTDLARLAATGTLRLLRHVDAGDRGGWRGDDTQRPLSNKGRRQASVTADKLATAEIDRVLTSPYVRCIESVAPLAVATGVEIEIDQRLAEDEVSDAAYDLVLDVVGYNAVICSHGDVIVGVLRRLRRQGLAIKTSPECAKGSIWEIDVDGGKFTDARYLPPP